MNNPQAFPTLKSIPVFDGQYTEQKPVENIEGMKLRDYFAAKAMQAIVTSDYLRSHLGGIRNLAEFASMAYRIADSMLAEREKGNK